jgi:inosine-uridine nucleoside N-ribohydrolase
LRSLREPGLTDEDRVKLLSSKPTVAAGQLPRVVLDTDAYNEIDDQFALAHVLLSSDKLDLEAIYAAPFHNSRSEGPGDGMEKSYEEIQRILYLFGLTKIPICRGVTAWLTGNRPAEQAPAVEDLIEQARSNTEGPLYVVVIGAPTNISTAILLAPEIMHRIVVVWLGGNTLSWPTAAEFNLQQDITASQVLFDSGVALVHVPCLNVADHLITTGAEIEKYVRPAGRVGDFLATRYADHVGSTPGVSKVLWDLAAVGWLLGPSWTTTVLAHSPVLTSKMTWSLDRRRHLISEVTVVDRDAIFADLFTRLADYAASATRVSGRNTRL